MLPGRRLLQFFVCFFCLFVCFHFLFWEVLVRLVWLLQGSLSFFRASLRFLDMARCCGGLEISVEEELTFPRFFGIIVLKLTVPLSRSKSRPSCVDSINPHSNVVQHICYLNERTVTLNAVKCLIIQFCLQPCSLAVID